VLKDFHAIGILGKRLDSGLWVSYAIDADQREPTWADIGPFGTSPYTVIDLPGSTVGRSIRIRVFGNTLLGGLETESPEIEAVDLRYYMLPDTVVTHQITIRATDYQHLYEGGNDTRNAKTIVAELQALQELTEPFAYYDIRGNSRTCKVVSVSCDDMTNKDKAGRDDNMEEAWVTITMLDTYCGGTAIYGVEGGSEL
jgi:hypothetical protein